MLLIYSPKQVARFLTALVLCIAATGTVAEFVRQATQSWSHKSLAGLAGKFVLDSELTIPAWYSSVAILGCSALLAVIALAYRRARSPFARH